MHIVKYRIYGLLFLFIMEHFPPDHGSHLPVLLILASFYIGHEKQHGAESLGSVNFYFCSIRQSVRQESNHDAYDGLQRKAA